MSVEALLDSFLLHRSLISTLSVPDDKEHILFVASTSQTGLITNSRTDKSMVVVFDSYQSRRWLFSGTRRPSALRASEDVNVKMVDSLT